MKYTTTEYITILIIVTAIFIPIAILDMMAGNWFFNQPNSPNLFIGIVISIIVIAFVFIAYINTLNGKAPFPDNTFKIEVRKQLEKDLKELKR